MLHYYQPLFFPFFGWRKHRARPDIRQLYYHSMEDAMWDVFAKLNVPQGSTILVPNFYCMDVLENLVSHGYMWQMYQVDEHFQPIRRSFFDALRRHHPSVVVVFHACGITNELLEDISWFAALPPSTLLVEDAVHRLVNASEIHLLNDRHLIMDSLRKVSPLPGGMVYGSSKLLSFPQTSHMFSLYSLGSFFWFMIFRIVLRIASIFNKSELALYAHEQLLQSHDNIIGDHRLPHRGFPLFGWIQQYIDVEKVEKMKKNQVSMYKKLLSPIFTSHGLWYQIHIPKKDEGKLHVFPLGIREKIPKQLLTYLRKNNAAILTKFEDSPWAKDKHVLFLPLGFHVKDVEIRNVCKLLQAFKV